MAAPRSSPALAAVTGLARAHARSGRESPTSLRPTAEIDTLCEAGQLVLALPESQLKADPLRQSHCTGELSRRQRPRIRLRAAGLWLGFRAMRRVDRAKLDLQSWGQYVKARRNMLAT